MTAGSRCRSYSRPTAAVLVTAVRRLAVARRLSAHQVAAHRLAAAQRLVAVLVAFFCFLVYNLVMPTLISSLF